MQQQKMQTNILAAIFAAAAVKESIGATTCIGQEILCLPYAGFFLMEESLILLYEQDRQWKGGDSVLKHLCPSFSLLKIFALALGKKFFVSPNTKYLCNYCQVLYLYIHYLSKF